MAIPVSFLQGIGKAALPIITGGVSSFVEIGSSIAAGVWEWWGKQKKETERRAELEALAQATAADVRAAVREVVVELAQNRPEPEQFRLESYLLAVPAQIRRTCRRPTDASGRTMPQSLALARMEDLVPLLPPRPPRFAAGDRVGDFELLELLGIGGFGEVWKARNPLLPGSPPVALKFCIDAEAADSLRREVELLGKIQWEGTHPGIVQLRQTYLSAEPPFLEYELVEGGDLGGLIMEWHRQRGGPTPAEAARLIQRLAEIVAFAHSRKIIHRDLKPANILILAGDGASTRLKIADFGIGAITAESASRAARHTGIMSTKSAAAFQGGYSLYYASPEQARGTAKADPRDDVHAIGVIWYQLLVGDLTAEAPRGPGWKKRFAAKGMPAKMIEFLESCTAYERDDRPASAVEVAADLGALLAEAPAPVDANTENAPSPALSQMKAGPVVISLEELDKVVDSVASQVRQLGDERKRTKFLTGLVTVIETLRKLAPQPAKLRWRIIKWGFVIGMALWIAGMAGLGVGAGTEEILTETNRSHNDREAQRLAEEYSTDAFTLKASKFIQYGSPPRNGKLNVDIGEFYSRRTIYIDFTDPAMQQMNLAVYSSNKGSGGYYVSQQGGFSSNSKDPSKQDSGNSTLTNLNKTLQSISDAYERTARPDYRSGVILVPVLVGIVFGILMAIFLWYARSWYMRRTTRRMNQTIDETLTWLNADYPVEMAKLDQINFRDADAVEKVMLEFARRLGWEPVYR
jgi:serine/threonine protein kinase